VSDLYSGNVGDGIMRSGRKAPQDDAKFPDPAHSVLVVPGGVGLPLLVALIHFLQGGRRLLLGRVGTEPILGPASVVRLDRLVVEAVVPLLLDRIFDIRHVGSLKQTQGSQGGSTPSLRHTERGIMVYRGKEGDEMSDGRDREIIVTNQGGGSGVGMIVATVLLVLAVIFAIWYQSNSDGGSAIPEDIDVNVNTEDPGTETTIPVN
jgi:hypothetical protein